MKKLLLFLMFLFLFFAAGFFSDTVFRGWGVFTNIILLWFFIAVSYRLRTYEIAYAGWFMGFAYWFFVAGSFWFWFFVFLGTSLVMMGVQGLASASGHFRFFFFVLAGWAGALFFRIIGLFFSGAARTVYGTVLNYVFSPAFGWEIVLSVLFLFCVAAAAYYAERKERIYYV